jgi:hypothetical protein
MARESDLDVRPSLDFLARRFQADIPICMVTKSLLCRYAVESQLVRTRLASQASRGQTKFLAKRFDIDEMVGLGIPKGAYVIKLPDSK